jgi:predicted CXXCH cytochrome family protein
MVHYYKIGARRVERPGGVAMRRMPEAAIGFFLWLLLCALPAASGAQDENPCLLCHGDPEFETVRGGEVVSLYVDPEVFARSMHADFGCVDCHMDVDPEDLPHPDDLEDVYCGLCHEDVQLDFDAGIHGQALNRNDPYAPHCRDCHGTHDILPPDDPDSQAYKTKIPYLCGGCHREGAPVARTYDISEHNIVENYSQSIHGEGLFKKGLTVTATCNDCHRSHTILPHTDPRSSISPAHIAETCMQCHSRIEEVHVQVIRGELWEEKPGAIPACTDCHRPHKVRKEALAITVSDRSCLKCHEREDIVKVADGDTISMTVDRDILEASRHENIPCVKCHADIDPRLHRPCETAGQVDCASCHAKISEEYYTGGHGRAHRNHIEEAPYCTTCHGDHDVLGRQDEDSPTYRASVPELCGDCHREDGKASKIEGLIEISAYTDYSQSVHGRGLVEKGLLPSAICTDCHGAHMVLQHSDKRSSVYRKNIPATCAGCHRGIYKDYIKSVHYSPSDEDGEKLPTCTDCHTAHTIVEVERDQFMTEVTHQCGACHRHLAETYLDTMHGKAYQLGYLGAAKCSDCHGAHAILGVNNPASAVGFRNIVETCRKCHEDANMRFTGYLTHATHHDPVKYPILFYTYWAMTGLLVGVFGFFGLHTLLWLPRSFREMRERRRARKARRTRYYIQRFTTAQRVTHLFVIVSFLSLALTGMMLKFSGMTWAGHLAGMLGGVRNAGIIHRTAAVVTFGYFLFHLTTVVRYKRRRRLTWWRLVFGKNSLMFNKKDLKDFWGTLKWFFALGPRPQYGRWTYWEKFDYLAVFWGVAVIGASGLMLWFPEFFTRFVPGWLINVAHIVHSDEALLAVGFIFTVHFFNTHLRPEAFPMDTVIFTGLVPVEEYKEDRPREYADLRESGGLRKKVVMRTISRQRELAIRIFGYLFLSVGVVIIGLIIYSVLFGYR